MTCVAVPLAVDGRTVGAVALLRPADQQLDDRYVEPAVTVAAVLAARVGDLADRARLTATHQRSDQVVAVVEQAVGTLAERRRTDGAAARAFLQDFAEQSGVPLGAATAAVLAGTAGPAVVPQPRSEKPTPRKRAAEAPADADSPTEVLHKVARPPQERPIGQYAPRPLVSAPTVRHRIDASIVADQFST